MLTAPEVERLAANLAQLGLDPVVHFNVVLAIGQALAPEGSTIAAPRGNGADAHSNGADIGIPISAQSARAPVPRRGRSKGVRQMDTPRTAPPRATPDANQHAMHVLRGALSNGPQSASRIEEMAERKGIGRVAFERAKELLGVTAQRLDGGMGVCYALPSQAANAATADA